MACQLLLNGTGCRDFRPSRWAGNLCGVDVIRAVVDTAACAATVSEVADCPKGKVSSVGPGFGVLVAPEI